MGRLDLDLAVSTGSDTFRLSVSVSDVESTASDDGPTVTKISSVRISGNSMYCSSITETLSGIEATVGDDRELTSVKASSYRMDATAYTGKTGYITGSGYELSEDGMKGEYTMSLDRDTVYALNGYGVLYTLMFFQLGYEEMQGERYYEYVPGIAVTDGMSLTLQDSYTIPVFIDGGSVTGTGYMCSEMRVALVADNANLLQSDLADAGFDLRVVFNGSSISSATMVACGEAYTAFEEYDEVWGTIPYTVNSADGTATLDSYDGLLHVEMAAAEFTVTVNGVEGKYKYGYTIYSEPIEERVGAAFAGITDGYVIAAPGNLYIVTHDATIIEVWVATTYEYDNTGGESTVSVEGDTYHVGDVSDLASQMGGNTVLNVTTAVGSVAIDVETITAGSSLTVYMTSNTETPYAAVNAVANGKTIYTIDLQAMPGTVLASNSQYLQYGVTLNGTGVPMAVGTDGSVHELAYTTENGTTTFYTDSAYSMYILGDRPSEGGSGGGMDMMLIVGIVVVVIVVIAVVAVVMMRRKATA